MPMCILKHESTRRHLCYLPEQCSRSFPEAGLSHTTHMVGPKQEPDENRCPFCCLSLASRSLPFPLENHDRDMGVNSEVTRTEAQPAAAAEHMWGFKSIFFCNQTRRIPVEHVRASMWACEDSFPFVFFFFAAAKWKKTNKKKKTIKTA